MIRRRPNRFVNLIYDGDWHTRMITALGLAREGTRSQEILAAIEVLERLLAKNDECVHTVTAFLSVPPSMDAQFLLNHVEQSVDVEPAALKLAPDGHVELTITARGDREHVHCMAKAILSSGLSTAKARIWADAMFSSGLPKLVS